MMEVIASLLLILARFQVVELPCALALEGHIVGFVAIYAAIVEVEALCLVVRPMC